MAVSGDFGWDGSFCCLGAAKGLEAREGCRVSGIKALMRRGSWSSWGCRCPRTLEHALLEGIGYEADMVEVREYFWAKCVY